MIDIKKLFTDNQQHLADAVRTLAEQHGFADYVKETNKPWEQSVKAVTQSIIRSLETLGLDGNHATPDVACEDEILAAFALDTSRRHRRMGINMAMFLSMLKFFRQAYLDTLRHKGGEDSVRERGFINRFFDRMEISQCVDWVRHAEEQKLLQAKKSNQAMANEKNRFLTLFDSLISSVFLLDNDLNIEIMNQGAADLITPDDLPKELRYARPSRLYAKYEEPEDRVALEAVLPWLHADVSGCQNNEGVFQESRFDTTATINGHNHYFTIAVSPVSDAWGQFKGTTVVVDEVTVRVEMERQLAHERNLAAEYLNVVGAIVLAIDTSGAIMLLNKTGRDMLGHENEELVGQDWFEIAISEEERDRVKDYYYTLIADDIDYDDRLTSIIETQGGERLLIEWNNRLLRNEGGLPIGVLASGMDVTERRKVEADLAEKELWLRNTFIALNEAVLILTPDRRIMDANPAAEVMFQLTNDELTDMSIADLHVSDEASTEYERLTTEAFEQGKTAEFQYDLRRKDGSLFPTENSVSLIANDEGMPLGVVNVIRDISNRKKAEMVLRESEEKFRRMFENMKDGFIVASVDGTILMVNPATCDLLGYKEYELVGEDISLLYAKEDERKDVRHQLATKGVISLTTLTATKKDGAQIKVEASLRLVLNDDSKPIGMEGTFRDITARTEAEKMLKEREKLYRAFFENNHAIMLLEDPKTGMIVDANPAASDFYGYSVEKLRSMCMSQIIAQSEEEIFQEMFTARKEKRSYFIFKHILSSGEERDVEVYSGPILVRSKQRLYSVIHDVTTRIRLERDMKRMATTDALTGANNRHQFFLLAKQEFERTKRYNHPLAVIMLDIDYFKSINDDYGHQTGDDVLKALADSAHSTLRSADIFGRLGGEEFAAILPETEVKEAMGAADRLREVLSKLTVQAKDQLISFTVSIGVTMAKESDDTLEEILNRADEALYKAKRGGRNRVVVS